MKNNNQTNIRTPAYVSNIMAARVVAETVKSTLGPKGMDKMIIKTNGEPVITNDGATILKELNIQHPIGRMVVDIALTQENEIGDGTTTAVILAAELLREAEELLSKGVHPTSIIKGYQKAAEESVRLLKERSFKLSDEELPRIVRTALNGKGTTTNQELLIKIILESVKGVNERDEIKIEEVSGKEEGATLLKGVLIDREVVNSNMAKEKKNAKILLIEYPLEVKSPDLDAKISISTPEQLEEFLAMEERMIKEEVERIISTGADVLISRKGIDEIAQHYLAKAGIMAVRRAKKSDLERLSKATGARIITNSENITEKDLGFAGKVVEERFGDEKMILVEECKNPRATTILISSSTRQGSEENARAIEDAIGVLINLKKDNSLIAGAGAPEIILSKELTKFANTLEGKEQLAVKGFAKAFETLPITLAENSGLDPIAVLTMLKADDKTEWPGIDLEKGVVMDSRKTGVIEPLKIKEKAIISATEVATTILRIDDVISADDDNNNNNNN